MDYSANALEETLEPLPVRTILSISFSNPITAGQVRDFKNTFFITCMQSKAPIWSIFPILKKLLWVRRTLSGRRSRHEIWLPRGRVSTFVRVHRLYSSSFGTTVESRSRTGSEKMVTAWISRKYRCNYHQISTSEIARIIACHRRAIWSECHMRQRRGGIESSSTTHMLAGTGKESTH